MLAPPKQVLPLRPHDRVLVLVESFPSLAATVVGTTRTEATLLLDQSGVPARMLHRRPAALEVMVERRRYRGDGFLAMVARRGKVRDDAIAFHFTDAESPIRRVHPRAPAVLPVTVVPVGNPLLPARALTVDLSAGGALVRGSAGLGLQHGTPLLLHIELPDEDLPIPARGAVVRQTADGLTGVRLDTMRDADRALVVEWVLSQATLLDQSDD
ncbi:MAG: hypothetical protein AVDCRST_MAG85-4000 [uncultured Solirubrobacteraceae bacterium]|uniref:PilZ domain-containing protein n=1 Tax=uncultured Solirubrobacteraceae bacterium TaxID=1162706 RepID=A0A6J4TZB8_9ACTN|nr:MAG: hypothetical protein AVDCRST_MAG85-4000 [uncultured Solirubrobacteraceae bacterium]